jgi:hypothetical protein
MRGNHTSTGRCIDRSWSRSFFLVTGGKGFVIHIAGRSIRREWFHGAAIILVVSCFRPFCSSSSS